MQFHRNSKVLPNGRNACGMTSDDIYFHMHGCNRPKPAFIKPINSFNIKQKTMFKLNLKKD